MQATKQEIHNLPKLLLSLALKSCLSGGLLCQLQDIINTHTHAILWSFLEPILPRTHFGVEVRGWYNGGEIGSRPIHCDNGFYMRLHFQSTPFLLGELFRSAPRHVACLHPVIDCPRTDDVRWSVVYIAGGHTLISSRVYERVDAHGQTALILGLHQRYPDLVDDID